MEDVTLVFISTSWLCLVVYAIYTVSAIYRLSCQARVVRELTDGLTQLLQHASVWNGQRRVPTPRPRPGGRAIAREGGGAHNGPLAPNGRQRLQGFVKKRW